MSTRFRRRQSAAARSANIILGTCLLAFTCPHPVQATALTGLVNGGVLSTLSPDGEFKTALSVTPVKRIADPSVEELTLLRRLYTKWQFVDGKDATGTFNVLQYDAFGLNQRGGAEFSVLYDDGVATSRADYSWIQLGYPKNWGAYDDTAFSDAYYSYFPFYANYSPKNLPNPDFKTPTSFWWENAIWLDANYPQQRLQNPAGDGKPPGQRKLPAGDLLFVDEPLCTYTCVLGDDTSGLLFDLFLVSFTWNGLDGSTAAGTVTIHDGLRWGVEIYRVPEPHTIALFGLGLLALLVIRSRRRRCRFLIVILWFFMPAAANAAPFISDIDLWFALYNPANGTTSAICKNPRIYPGGPACSTPSSPMGNFAPAPLWVPSGATVRMWVDVEFTRWQFGEVGEFLGPLAYEASIWEHDDESLLPPYPGPGFDDQITSIGLTGIGSFPGMDNRRKPRATIGPFDFLLTRADIGGAQRVNCLSSKCSSVIESAYVIFPPLWPLLPSYPEDQEGEAFSMARTLEIYSPVEVLDNVSRDVLDTKNSARFYLSVVLPGELPPAGALRLPEPSSMSLTILGIIALVSAKSLRRRSGRQLLRSIWSVGSRSTVGRPL